jgi:hypothetical protein
MPRRPAIWDEDRDRHLIQLPRDGVPYPAACRLLGVSTGACQKRAGLLRITTPQNPRWTDAELNCLRLLRSEGRTYPECSRILGRSASSCQHVATRLGIPPRRPPRGSPWFWTPTLDQRLLALRASGCSRLAKGVS